MTCEWVCPDCDRKCGIDFARTGGKYEQYHEDYHVRCGVEDDDAPGYGGTD